MRQRGAELWAKWRGLASEQSRTGPTVAAFCRGRGLRDALFYDWKKRLREGEAAKFIERKVHEPGEPAKPMSGHVSAPGRAIEISLQKGRGLLVEPGFDADHLRASLAALEYGA